MEAQIPTWILKFQNLGYEIFPYFAEPKQADRSLEEIVRTLENSIARNELLNKFHLNRFRVVRKHPSTQSEELTTRMMSRSVDFDAMAKFIRIDSPDSLATVGITTLLAMKYVLDNYDFDYLARTNTSSYLDLNKLKDFLSKNERGASVIAQMGLWGRHTYPSGALYVLPRRQVRRITEGMESWIHDYIDDVALGLLLNFPSHSYLSIPRYAFNSHLRELPKKKELQGFMHYRCKGKTSDETIRNMLEVHKALG